MQRVSGAWALQEYSDTNGAMVSDKMAQLRLIKSVAPFVLLFVKLS